MLPKKARRERALSVPTTSDERPSGSGQRNAHSASATSKYRTFFNTASQGMSNESAVKPSSSTPEEMSSSNLPTTSFTPPSSTSFPSFAQVTPQSTRAYSDKRPLISPRVFNFYELTPSTDQHSRRVEDRGTKSSPIVLSDDYNHLRHHHLQPDGEVTGMSSKRQDGGSGKLDTQFLCTLCNKICNSQAQLIIHQHSHKYPCPICPDTFSKKELLQTHMLHHWPNSEHYICNIEGCNRRFSNAVLLQKHIEHEHLITSAGSVESPRRRISESSDWSPVPQQSPSSPWQPPDSPVPPADYFRSPTGSITSPLCRRSIGSEGGPFKPYRSPGPVAADWRNSKTILDEQLKYIQSLRDSPQVTQYITQQVIAQQQHQPDHHNKKLLLEHHLVQQSALLNTSASSYARAITLDVSSPNILTPQPIKHGCLKRRHTSSESSVVHSVHPAGGGVVRAADPDSSRVETPEPSPNLTDTKPSLLSPDVFIDMEPGSMGGLELLGQVSSQLSRLHEGEQVKNKTKPAPLDLPSDPHFALTPPYTGTPRYLWTPTKSSASTFFSPEPRKIRVGKEFQADIPQLVSSSDAPAPEEPMDGLLTPVYTPPIELEDEKNREKFLKDTIPVYPDTEYLHHCVHFTGGDLKEAARLARCPIQSKLADHHPLHKYRYSGQYKWTNDDQERFLLLFQRLGRNLSQIAKWMPDKKLSDIVEYYYFWKVRNPDVYKLWRNQSNCRLAQPPEFDPKPAKPSRTRNKKEIVYFETEAYTTHDSNGNKEIKFRQKKVVNPYSGSSPRPRSNKPPNPQPLGSYKCKVCGKEFQKVKSRSAHMKTHKRQQNAAAGMLPTQTLLQQQYQLQSQQHLHQQLQQQLKHLQHPDLVTAAGATGSQLDVHLSHDMMTSRASGTQSTVTMTTGSDVTRTSKAKRGQT